MSVMPLTKETGTPDADFRTGKVPIFNYLGILGVCMSDRSGKGVTPEKCGEACRATESELTVGVGGAVVMS